MEIDDDPKAMARRLRTALTGQGHELTHSQCLELIAKAYGIRDWNTLAAARAGSTGLGTSRRSEAIPVLRVFGRDLAHSFYVDGLGFRLDAEQGRADLHEPVRMVVSYAGARLQLTEHNDDASPGGATVITVGDVIALHHELEQSGAIQALAGVEQTDGGPVLVVVDPFRNRLVFHQGGALADSRAAGPIEQRVRLDCSPAHAFTAFTGRIGTWWPAEGYAPGPLRDVRIEPRVGGRVIMVLSSGELYQWGTVLQWEPGHRYRQTFTLAQDPEHPTELDVTFDPEGSGTLVRFAHGGWTAGNLDRRSGFADWPLIFQRFAAVANGGEPTG